MDELHDRFHRLDRKQVPDLWYEAVGRAAELDAPPRREFNPAIVLVAAALLIAALAGTIAVGGWVNRPEVDLSNAVYSNGVIAVHDGCGGIIGIEPETGLTRELVASSGVAECPVSLVDNPAWSADGRWLAYIVSRPIGESDEGDSEAWVRDMRSGTAVLVRSCSDCGALDISPDGSLVTYIELGDRGLELVVAPTDGGATHRVPFFGSPGEPAFSPDGKAIAIPLIGGTSGIHVLDVSSLDETAIPTMTLLHGPVASQAVSWSPDGQWLAFDKVVDGGVRQIWTIRSNGTDARMLASDAGEEVPAYPTWSADSSTIAYVATHSDVRNRWRFELWTATLEGETNLAYRSAPDPWDFMEPEWSPDGEWIALGVDYPPGASGSGLFLVRPDGSDLRRLSDFGLGAAWQSLVEEP